MKIDVLCTRELDFQGSGGSKNGGISNQILEGVQRVLGADTFIDFDDFGVPVGVPKGSILEEKGSFLRFEIVMISGVSG